MLNRRNLLARCFQKLVSNFCLVVGMAAMMARVVLGRVRNHKFVRTLSVQPAPPKRCISDSKTLGFWSPRNMQDSKLLSHCVSYGWKWAITASFSVSYLLLLFSVCHCLMTECMYYSREPRATITELNLNLSSFMPLTWKEDSRHMNQVSISSWSKSGKIILAITVVASLFTNSAPFCSSSLLVIILFRTRLNLDGQCSIIELKNAASEMRMKYGHCEIITRECYFTFRANGLDICSIGVTSYGVVLATFTTFG